MTAREKLEGAFMQALGIPTETAFDSLSYRSIEQWDSVAHMQLVNAIERTFNVMLETEEVLSLSNFLKAKEILEKHGVDFNS
jgi:acyl carrier protein